MYNIYMQKTITKFLILTIILTAALSVNYLFAAWVGPTQAPPGGNTSTPVHVGSTNQVKEGGLSVEALSVFGSGYFQGNVGVGVVVPTQKLDIGGKIKVGNDATSPDAGTIRWTGTEFQAYNGTKWVAFAKEPAYVDPVAISSPTLSDHVGHPFSNAVDENWGTLWNSQPDYISYVGRKVDLEYDEAFIAVKFAIKFDGSTRSNVVSMTIFGANDDMVWEQIVTGLNYSGSYSKEIFSFSNSNSYNHYRVRIDSATADTGYSNVWEIAFYRR